MRVTAIPDYTFIRSKPTSIFLNYLVVAAVCFILASCTGSILPGITSAPQCQNNCTVGAGIQGVQVFVEPDDGEHVITNAIGSAQRSIWLEIYIQCLTPSSTPAHLHSKTLTFESGNA